jgi:hypothetical protein
VRRLREGGPEGRRSAPLDLDGRDEVVEQRPIEAVRVAAPEPRQGQPDGVQTAGEDRQLLADASLGEPPALTAPPPPAPPAPPRGRRPGRRQAR